MKKILLFSALFFVAAVSVNAQDKDSKKNITDQKKTVACSKTPGQCHQKIAVSKKQKQVTLQRAKLQPAIVPAELRDERAN